jgi:hypothetical protein
VLLLTLAGLERSRLGCFGGVAQTPNIDRLAREGLRFGRTESWSHGAETGEAAQNAMVQLHYVGFRACSNELGTQWPAQGTHGSAARLACARHVGTQRVAERALAFIARVRRKSPERRMFVQLDLEAGMSELELTYADSQLGRVIKALERAGDLTDTLLMVASAQAGALGELLIMRWPERIPARGEMRLRAARPLEVLGTLLAPYTGRDRLPRHAPHDTTPKLRDAPFAGPRKFVYHPATTSAPDVIPKQLLNREHRITAAIVSEPDARGLLICHASVQGGYALYVEDRSVHYVLTYVGGRTLRLRARDLLPHGRCEVKLEYKPATAQDVANGRRSPGRVRLLVGGRLQASVNLPAGMPLLVALAGRSGASTAQHGEIIRCYEQAPFAFGYDLRRVAVEVGPELRIDAPAEMRAVIEGSTP